MTASDPLPKVVWHALHSSQLDLAEICGGARRYRAAVAPFAAVDSNTPEALDDLAELMSANEVVYVLGDMPAKTPRLRWDGIVPCLQMLFPPELPLADPDHTFEIEELTCAHSGEMMELIAIAFPGYFREETCRMGRYFGVREQGKLVAMAGERMVLETQGEMWREVSALCTHPDHTGRGLGTALMRHIIGVQRALGAITFLHVIENNTNAIRLYEKFGFETAQRVKLHKLVRV